MTATAPLFNHHLVLTSFLKMLVSFYAIVLRCCPPYTLAGFEPVFTQTVSLSYTYQPYTLAGFEPSGPFSTSPLGANLSPGVKFVPGG
jgi:hypothetical protein